MGLRSLYAVPDILLSCSFNQAVRGRRKPIAPTPTPALPMEKEFLE